MKRVRKSISGLMVCTIGVICVAFGVSEFVDGVFGV